MMKHLKSKEDERPKIFSVSSVSEFVEVATYFDDGVVFRGQTISWPLVPMVGRNQDRSQFILCEKEMFDAFKRESVPYLDFVPRNDWQWLALAQHKRLPTRLLDWTRNPLAALWFAVKDSPIDAQPGVVWVLYANAVNVAHLTDTAGTPDPFSIDKTYLYFPEHVYPLIQAQMGVFTVHHREKDKFPCLDTAIEYQDLCLQKVEIPADKFCVIRYELFRLGISPASLFPGLSGLTERIQYENMKSADES
jgi:hypothetical protein